MRKSIVVCLVLVSFFALLASWESAQAADITMCYNGPPDVEKNAVHLFATNFKRFLETRTEGEITVSLYPDSQLGNEDERMELVTQGILTVNVASFAGMSTVLPEIFASNVPFMFNSYQAAHLFFDKGKYWNELSDLFKERTGSYLLEAVEEGGFLAFTNSKRELRTPADFSGLRFRAMDESQVALYKSFGASGTPIPWTEVYLALQTGVADGQMNPPMYIIIGSLYEVQDYMTMANIQYSDQFIVINGDWFDSLSPEHQLAVKQAAYDANVVNRVEVETMVQQRVNYIAYQGVQVYYPTNEEMDSFRQIGQPGYIEWLTERVDEYWIDLALQDAKRANEEAEKDVW